MEVLRPRRDRDEGEEAEPEARARAAHCGATPRRGEGLPAPGRSSREESPEGAARGVGEHRNRPLHRAHPPRVLRGPDARVLSAVWGC
uniref:Uncharacterized protein n=1 Tax=Arundo donax TaxID=35708 RepID=A0A0A9ENA1_ARUDO